MEYQIGELLTIELLNYMQLSSKSAVKASAEMRKMEYSRSSLNGHSRKRTDLLTAALV